MTHVACRHKFQWPAKASIQPPSAASPRSPDDITSIKSKMATKNDIARLDARVEQLKAKIDSVESNLIGKINRLDTKLTKSEENEIDKCLQFEFRVSAIEKHLGLDKKIAAGLSPRPSSPPVRTTDEAPHQRIPEMIPLHVAGGSVAKICRRNIARLQPRPF